MRSLPALLIGLACALPGAASAQQTEPDAPAYRQDALSIEPLINSQYAYLDRFPDGVAPMSPFCAPRRRLSRTSAACCATRNTRWPPSRITTP